MEEKYTALEWATMEGGQTLDAKPVEKFSFLNDLTEARMFRNTTTLAGKSAKDLADVVFLSFMMLEILRIEDNAYAKRYANNTIWDNTFSSMKSSATDLHNLIAVLSNQTKYSSKIKADAGVNVPTIQIRKYLRDIENNRKDRGWDRAFFKTLGEFLKISKGELKQMRVVVADWNRSSTTEKQKIRLQIKNLLHPSNFQNDLLTHFRTTL